MIRILANDGIHSAGKNLLEKAGYQVDTEKISQEDLMQKLNDYDAIIVRSATKVRKNLIDAAPNLKIIARAGVGIDNIDHEYAKSIGKSVINTPSASSKSVAELAFAHLFSLSRFVYDANRNMPQKGAEEFKKLKKAYAKGAELRGKTIGIVGFGRIGQEVAKIALGMGMNILPVATSIRNVKLSIDTPMSNATLTADISTVEMDTMLAHADFITCHIPGGEIITETEIEKMKDGVILVNTARGGVINEDALLKGIENGKIASAGIDVFVNEPTPSQALLDCPKISLTPHIGASTLEAQRNIGLELAEKIIAHFEK